MPRASSAFSIACADGADDVDAGPALVLGGDHVPPPGGVVGALEHVLDRFLVVLALLPVAPVLLGELPGLVRVGLARLEPAQLLLGGEVHPELDQDHALGGQRGLQVHDLGVRPLPRVHGREALDPFHEHPAVPGAVEHGHAAPAGQDRPEAPQEVVPLLVVAGRRELGDPHVPGVELADQALDGPALAGGVPALEQHAQRRSELTGPDLPAEQKPQVHQTLLGSLQVGLALLLGDLLAQVDVRESAHAVPPWQARLSAARRRPPDHTRGRARSPAAGPAGRAWRGCAGRGSSPSAGR